MIFLMTSFSVEKAVNTSISLILAEPNEIETITANSKVNEEIIIMSNFLCKYFNNLNIK
jgi:hypothetical protein